MENINISVFKEKELKFFIPFLFYILGLGCYLSTLLPYMDALIPQKLPENIIEKVKHLDYIIALAAFFVLLLGAFFEGIIMFLVANFLGAKVKFQHFLTLFTVANLPMALRFIIISIKNCFVSNPSTYLFFEQSNKFLSAFDLFNISYLVILFLLVKHRTELKANFPLGVFIVIAFIYRTIF
ncbi:hypothetical protein [Bacillus sp. MUM 13]|uniref:hypothetical protein n=1 Tax=Bacillus sp. MUM 13 TaxID=1678001 RepID=UPI0008F5F004|nr:hypothetical protein [Bacillus sp. MUM 13]OIK09972.1 hypothetical protein BIV59_15455 [Bacillus sp. MUM 13]